MHRPGSAPDQLPTGRRPLVRASQVTRRAARRRRGGSFRHALRAEALRRAELPRPVAPGDRPRAVPAISPGAAPVREDQAVRHAPDALTPEKRHSDGAERSALSGLPPPTSTVLRIPQAGRAYGALLTLEPLPAQRA